MNFSILTKSLLKSRIMKKNLFVMMGVMVAATFTLTNCTEEKLSYQEVEKSPYTIYANFAETKTVNNVLSTFWSEGDALNVFHAPAGSEEYGENTQFELVDAPSGMFATKELKGNLSNVNDWYVIYPYSPYVTTPAATESGYINVGSKSAITQNGYGDRAHLAGTNCPLYGVASGVSDQTLPSLTMNHLTSVVKVLITNNSGADVVVSNVAFTAPESICGTFYVDVTGDAPVYVGSGNNYVSNTASVNVTGEEKLADGETAEVYVVFKPFTAPAGSELKLAVNGVEKVKDVDADVTFEAGVINTLKFSIDAVAEPVTIAEVIEGGAGKAVLTEGLVVATYARGFIIEDETGKILVYENASPAAEVGDMVTVTGTTSSYAGLLQIGAPSVEVVSSGNEVSYPEPDVLDAEGMDAQLKATEISYIEYTGVLSISNGKYFNIAVEGTETAIGSISYPIDDLTALDGKTVTVTGYFIGVTSKKYVNVMAVTVKEKLNLEDCVTPDGKQWVYQDYDGYWHVLDFGVTTEGTLYNAFEPAAMEEDGDAYLYFEGEELEYEIIPTSVNSGTVVLTTYAYEEPISFEMTYEFTNGPTTMVVNESEIWGLEDVNAFEVTESIAIEMFGLLDTEHVSPDGKQWLLPMNELLSAAFGGMPTTNFILDLGVSWQNMYTAYWDDPYMILGIDYETIYGEEAAGFWVGQPYGAYNVFNDDATSGVINWMGAIEIPYSDITETTCTFDLTNLLHMMFYYEDFDEGEAVFEATLVDEFIPITVQ